VNTAMSLRVPSEVRGKGEFLSSRDYHLLKNESAKRS
jgi:hypothetical protein